MLERLFFLYIIVAFTTLRGQTTLTAGDLMMVTVNADGDDNFDFVPLVDLESNTVIYFADNAWDGSALKSNEGTLKYTSSSSVSAGAIVSYSGSLGGEWANEDAGFLIAATGDNILVFQGSPSDPTFIYGIGWALGTVWISEGTVSTHNSYIPSGISTSDNTVVQLGTSDNYQYDTDNGTSGPKSTLRYLTAQTSNYNYHNSNYFAALSGSFDVGQVISGSSNHFRMMSSPESGTVYDAILEPLWIQGMTGGDVTSGTANVWTYNGAEAEWEALTNLNTASHLAGEGFLVYVFTDTDNDGDDDLPVTVDAGGDGTEISGNVDYGDGSIPDNAWGFAGNPYASTIDWGLVTQSNVTTSAYVWDSQADTPAYISWNGTDGSLTGGLIAPYQGFFVQGSGGSGSITIAEADKSSTAGTFYKTTNDSTGSMSFSISSGDYSDITFVSFMNNGEGGIDNADAYKLLPMTASERVVGISYADGNGLDISNLPYTHDGAIDIPLDIMYLTVDADYNFVTNENEVTMNWDLSSLPETIIGLTLTNNTTGETTDLLQTDELTFITTAKGSFPAYGSNGVNIYPEVGESQFTLAVAYSALSSGGESTFPTKYALHKAFPNPFNPSTTIRFDLPEEGFITMNVYDVTGRLVETLVNMTLPAGYHSHTWYPVSLSSGLYIVQLKAGETVFNQKITFIK